MALPQAPEAAHPGSRASRARLISSSLYSVASYLLALPINLAVTSFVVHRLGLGTYGIWVALTTILGYGGLLDLGMSTPLIKYVAEYMALGKQRELNVLLSTVMVFYLAVGTVFLAGMTLLSTWILVHMFHASAQDMALRELYLAVMVAFVASLSFSVVQSLIVGLQHADLLAKLRLGLNLISAAGTVLVVSLGLGVGGLGLNWLAMAALGIGTNWIVAKRLFPLLGLNPFQFRWTYLKRMLRFSTKVQVTTITHALNDQVDATLIAYVLGPSMLGLYALASRAALALRGLSLAMMSGILPAASDLAALNQTTQLQHLYLRASRYLAILDFGLFAGTGGLAQPLIYAWLGPGYGRTATTLMIIMLSYGVWLPSQATDAPLYGMGRPDIRMRADLAFLAMHIPLSLALMWRFGYFGTVIGTSFALSVTRIYFYIAGAHALEVGTLHLVRFSFLQPAAGALIALAAVTAPQLAGAPLSLPMLVVEGVLFCTVYAGYVGMFGLDSYDRDLARSYLRTLFHGVVSRFRAAA